MASRRATYTRHAAFAAFALATHVAAAQSATPPPIPITGEAAPSLAAFDSSVVALMQKYAMPGASIAVAVGGRLVHARGFGWSDIEARVPVEPTSMFRIASISKPITSAAIMKLVETGRLKLSDRAIDYLHEMAPAQRTVRDPRIDSITIDMLLQHTAGWARDGTLDLSFAIDTMPWPHGVPRPAAPADVIRYMLGATLRDRPGSVYSYSNFGYTVLGRVIERASGVPYETYVRNAILEPAGVTGMRLGRSQLADRAPNEVKYYARGGSPFDSLTRRSIRTGVGNVPRPYAFDLEVMDAAAGWTGSAIDVARFILAVDGQPSRPDVVDSAGVRAMTALPRAGPLPKTAFEFVSRLRWASGSSGGVDTTIVHADANKTFVTFRAASFAIWLGSTYASGWYVDGSGPRASWWHDGRLSGTSTLAARSASGPVWVALFNATPKDPAFYRELETLMWNLDNMAPWPTGDLFERYR